MKISMDDLNESNKNQPNVSKPDNDSMTDSPDGKEPIDKVTPNGTPPNGKPPKPPTSKRTIIGVFAVLAIFLGVNMFTRFSDDSSKQEPKETVASKPEKKQKETNETKESSQQSKEKETATSEAPAAPQKDLKPMVAEFFTTFRNFTAGKDSPKDRVEKLKKYASEQAIETLIPKDEQEKADQVSLITVYKLVKPVDVIDDPGSPGIYAANMTYTAETAGNKSQHTDSFIIKTKDDKITEVIPQSSVLDN